MGDRRGSVSGSAETDGDAPGPRTATPAAPGSALQTELQHVRLRSAAVLAERVTGCAPQD